MKLINGMNKDVDLINLTDGDWSNARNIVQDKDNDIINEKGFTLLEVLNENFVIIGKIECGNLVVLFSTDNTTSEIGTFNGTTYTRIFRDSSISRLNFSTSYPIRGEYFYNYKGELVITWTDNYNQIRTLNLDDLPFAVDASKVYSASNLYKEYQLIDFFPDINGYPVPTIISSNKVYHSLVEDVIVHLTPIYRYKIDEINYTNWFAGVSSTVHCFGETLRSSNPQFSITISLLDRKFNYIQVGVIETIDGVSTGKLIMETEILQYTTLTVDYFYGKRMQDISLNDIMIPKATFKHAKTLTQIRNRLAISNITQTSKINYQKYANNIAVHWHKTLSSIQHVKDEYDCNYFSGNINENITEQFSNFERWCPEEVYAFYITLILKDGSETEAFHIPGRAFYGSDLEEVTVANGYTATEESLAIPYGTTLRRYVIKDTSSYIGISSNNPLGYWQNVNEFYPSTGEDTEIWESTPGNPTVGRKKLTDNTLAGMNVRHHKMPSLNTSGGTKFYLSFNDIFFPNDILSLIKGYYISYSCRDKWKTVLGESVILPTNIERVSNYPNILYAHPIDLMIEQAKVSMHYLKKVYSCTDTIDLLANNDIVLCSGLNYAISNDICRINEYLYTYRDIGEYTINSETYGGLTFSAVGVFGQSQKLILSTNNTGSFIPSIVSNVAYNFTTCSINRLLQDVHFPYYEQELIPITSSLKQAYTNVNLPSITNIDEGDMLVSNTKIYNDVYYFYEDSVGSNTSFGTDMRHQLESFQLKYASITKLDNTLKETAINAKKNELLSYNNYDTYAKRMNYYEFCKSYPALNKTKSSIPHQMNDQYVDELPYRTARSASRQFEALGNGWRSFNVNDYYEYKANKGAIQNVQAIGDTLLIQTTDTSLLASIKDVLITNNVDAYLGEGDIFDREPTELIDVTNGYAGNQHQFGTCLCKYGFIFIDYKRGKVFLLKDSLTEISNTGLSKFFKTKSITACLDNPYNANGITISFDEEYERLLFTRVNSAFTLSYSFVNEKWLAYHDYTPRDYIKLVNGFYSIVKVGNYEGIYKHNSSGRGLYYHTDLINLPTRVPYESYIEPIFVYNNTITKLLQSIKWQSTVIHVGNGDVLELDTISAIAVYTKQYFTGIIILKNDGTNVNYRTTSKRNNYGLTPYIKGLYRLAEGTWRFNEIRDMLWHEITDENIVQLENPFINQTTGVLNTIQINALPITKPYWDRNLFIDKFFAVRFINDNVSQHEVRLHDVDIEAKQSIR